MPGAGRRPLRGDLRTAAPTSSPTGSRRSPRAASKLESGDELEADIVVTATGLNLLFLGGIEVTVDGEEVDFRDDDLQGHDAQRRPEPRLHARLHQRVLDAEGRPHLRVRLPPAQPHGRARLHPVRAAGQRHRSPATNRSSTSPPATSCAPSTGFPNRAPRIPGSCARTTPSTFAPSATAPSPTARWSSPSPAPRARPSRQSPPSPDPDPPLGFSSVPGALAEWLRSGLQSRLHRFDSGRRLSRIARKSVFFGFSTGFEGPGADPVETG